MNIELLRARLAETVARMRSMVDDYTTRNEDFSDEDQTQFDELAASAEEDRELISKVEKRFQAIESGASAVESGSDIDVPMINTRSKPYDVSTLRWDVTASELRSRAAEAIETDEHLPDPEKEAATQVLRKVDRRGEIATMILMTGHPDYRSAFPKIISGNEWALTDNERKAVARAQSTSAASGGYAVPFTLDPTVILTNDGTINPMRQLATIRTITTEDWNGVTSAGATAHWRGEAEQADDDSITLAQPTIPVHKMDLFIPYSIEIEMDWAQMESEMREVMVDAKMRKEAAAHFSGTGSDQPTGVITALVASSPSVLVAPATAETFALTDVYNIRRLLPPRYRPTRDVPAWVANIGTYDDIRQFDTGGGGGFWTSMADGTPDRLLSYRTFETSEMDDTADLNPAVTANNRVLLFGDFKRYYIVDRIGMRVETIPHLFGTANNRPTGQRGIYAVLRTGADSIDDNAFRLLNIPTTA